MSFQGLVTFKDVAVCFSQDQWSDLDPEQKEFYGEYVLEEDCGIVVSLCKASHASRETVRAPVGSLTPAPHPQGNQQYESVQVKGKRKAGGVETQSGSGLKVTGGSGTQQ